MCGATEPRAAREQMQSSPQANVRPATHNPGAINLYPDSATLGRSSPAAQSDLPNAGAISTISLSANHERSTLVP